MRLPVQVSRKTVFSLSELSTYCVIPRKLIFPLFSVYISGTLNPKGKIPVVVWIHGGG